MGHSDIVLSVCICGDGSRIISGSRDETVKVWNAMSGVCVNTLEGHSNYVSSVCFSSDGTRIISGSWDKTVKVWDALSGVCVNALEGHIGEVL